MPQSGGFLRFVEFFCSKTLRQIRDTSKRTANEGFSSMAAQRNPDSTLIWRKSRASGGGGECLEVARSELSVLVRDTRDESGAMLEFGQVQWRGFVGRVKNGDALPG
jgi:hypothetical protein